MPSRIRHWSGLESSIFNSRHLGSARCLVRLDVVEFYWLCQAVGSDPAETAGRVMESLADLEPPGPGEPRGAGGLETDGGGGEHGRGPRA